MKRNKAFYMGIFIIVIMVSSTFGFILSYSGHSNSITGNIVKVNNKELISYQGYWVLNEGKNSFTFHNLPEDVQSYKELQINNQVNLFSEEINEVQLNRLSFFLASKNVRFQIADEWDCSNDTQTLVISTGLDNIYKDDNCLFLEGDIEKSIDKIGYSLLL